MPNTLSLGQRPLLFVVLALFGILAACSPTATTAASASPGDVVASGELERKSKRTSGDFEIVETENGHVLRLSDNFRTGSGPDVKVFLSRQNASSANGRNATRDAVLLFELPRTSGTHEIAIPSDIDISEFRSVLIHCEQYSVLFGAGDIRFS